MPLEDDIHRSETLPSSFYFDQAAFEAGRERIFARTWQWIGDSGQLFADGSNIIPFNLHDEFLDDPLILIRQPDSSIRCLSNVCTHRGFILVQEPSRKRKLVCGYHGRRFDLEGQFEFMPEFENVSDSPRECDHLAKLPLKQWRNFLFTSYDPIQDFECIYQKIDERVSFLPIENFTYQPEFDRAYTLDAHWALYCDNFLEGFHIPFVHEALNDMLDYGSYSTELSEDLVLQIGYADGNTPTFDLPKGHVDHGKAVTAYYYWVFPNLMYNFYPWGLQVNIVRPISAGKCRVDFLHYLSDEALFKKMNGINIADKTQWEDEDVVQGVQRGLASRFYTTGRFSPKREQGVHYFHRLIQQWLTGVV